MTVCEPGLSPVSAGVATDFHTAFTDEEGDYKTCPYAGSAFRQEATRCRYCGEVWQGPQGRRTAVGTTGKDAKFGAIRNRTGPHVLTFGIMSLVLLIVLFHSCIAFRYRGVGPGPSGPEKNARRRHGSRGMGMTQAGYICGIVGTIISSLLR